MSYKPLSACMKVILFFTLLLQLQPSFAQYNWNDLERELQVNQKQLGTDAMVMIWKNDSLIYQKEMGTFNAKTVAPVASASKWLTAALIMKLAEEGKFSLDDKVVRYIPELDKYFKGYITIRQCLSHMTGIEDEGNLLKKMFQRKKFNTLEEEISSFAARDIRANPGKDFWYGNIGLNIAARVAEVVTKRKFDALIKQKLFTPLGMKKSTFSNLDGSAVNPSAGAKSTAEDYMRFLVMLLNNGTLNGIQYLTAESVSMMREIQNDKVPEAYAPESSKGFKYALGSWASDGKSVGNKIMANVLASPGLFGTWPMIDYCRGYAYLVFVKDLLNEEKAKIHLDVKNIIDKQMKTECR